ncbi:DNA ligase 4-like [Tigriopus californicus]|uniref:DNA ligase 4-like n=1 Tax=Tigriopus californicus TaxID=6832 RepID=UPI0027DA118F|nr:DNA ligase 4-like [Tigriopus californicus]
MAMTQSSADLTSRRMAFRDLADFCQAVVNVGPKSGQDAKGRKLTSFLQFCRTQWGPSTSLFPLIRLLLPQLDRERGSYGIKETVLARLFIRSLGLGEGSADALRLKNFRAPKGLGSQSDTGDFAAVLYAIIKDRGYPDGQLSVNQVNSFLDQLAEAGAQGGQRIQIETLLMDVFKKMSPVQVKWLVRIILKDMRLGLGQSAIFKAVHPDAKELYEVNANLGKVCEQLKDPSKRLNEIAVQLFHPFKPMLAERGVLERVEQQMGHKSFFIEVKYDGERLQIHKDHNDAYKYFSRNCHDFTSDFGDSPREWGSFTQILSKCLSSHVRSVILDGEICAYNYQTDCLTLKGDKMNIRGLKSDDPMYQQCLYAYDVLFLNGEVLTNKPLRERIEILKSVVQERKGRIHFAQRCQGSSKAEVIQALNEAIDRREEGIVLKDTLSIYKPNARSGGGWLKIKPDYSNQLTDQCDLVVMGGYYGTGRKGRGIISHFLLGVLAATQEDKKDHEPSHGHREIHSLCRVGSGYSMKELYDLLQRLEPHFIKAKWDSGPSNDLLRVDDFGLRMGREKPDVVISPKKSVILQINAAEVIASDGYYTGCTLRFPRVEQIRTDKTLEDCMTTHDLETIRREAQGKLSRRYVESEASDEPSKKRRRKVTVGAASQSVGLAKAFGPTDLSTVMIESHNLKDQVIVIEPTNGVLKAQLEAIVVKHGGIVEQNPVEGRTFCYVETGMKMKAKSVDAKSL